MDLRHGKTVDSVAEASLVRDFSTLIAASANEDLPAIKVMILDKTEDWKLGAVPAYRLLCEIEQRLRPGQRMSRVTRDGEIVPMEIIGG
jgi:hypothetical protein